MADLPELPSLTSMAPQATLVNTSTGDRVAVEIGSAQESEYMALGYVLETEAPTGTGEKATVYNAAGEPLVVNVGDPIPEGYAIQPMTAEQQAAKYAEAVRAVATKSAEDAYDSAVDDPDESYDARLDTQRAEIMAALYGEATYPENYKYLSGAQQAAIKAADKRGLQAQLIAVNSIIDSRAARKKEEEADAQAKLAAAQQQLQFLQTYGLLGSLTSEQLTQLETDLGLSSGALTSLDATKQYAYTSYGGKTYQWEVDPVTGQQSNPTVVLDVGGGSGGGDTVEDTAEDFTKKAVSYMEQIYAGDITMDQAVSLLSLSFPEYDPVQIEAYLEGNTESTEEKSVLESLTLKYYGLDQF